MDLKIRTIDDKNDEYEKPKTVLLCTFVKTHNVDKEINNIVKTFNVVGDKIYVLNVVNGYNDSLLTYNISEDDFKYKEVLENTININRKKHTNTLYTINAINTIIKEQNNGVLDHSIKINWSKYRNCLLLSRQDDLVILKTKLSNISRIIKK